jgi:hypothetical protein
MVIMLGIGQSAGLPPTSVMVGYGGLSTTERSSVGYERLPIWSWLKIQSIPLGKLRGIEEHSRSAVT